MLFQIDSLWQILGWVLVFAGLIIMNEIGRRSKAGGILLFVISFSLMLDSSEELKTQQ